MQKNMQKKIFGKIDFKCVLLDFYKSRVSESIGNFSQKLIYGLKLVQAVFKSPLKNSSRLVRTRPSNPEPKSHWKPVFKKSILMIFQAFWSDKTMNQWIYFHRTLSEGQENYRRSKTFWRLWLEFFAFMLLTLNVEWLIGYSVFFVYRLMNHVIRSKTFFFISYCHDMREKMGNKNNHKHRRPAGKDKKTTSKGNIYFNSHQILIADWLRLHTAGFPSNIKDSECMSHTVCVCKIVNFLFESLTTIEL